MAHQLAFDFDLLEDVREGGAYDAGNIEWNRLGNEKVIEHSSCFTTESGKLIFWSGQEAQKAQTTLSKLALKHKDEINIMAKEISNEALDCLKNVTVLDNIITLPQGQLDRKVYVEVKARLELIGGKWKGGKINGFVFDEDPTQYLDNIQNGDKRNLKKEFQFFATPDSVCDRLVELADINEQERVLEPSAGRGAIISAINRVHPKMYVECFELMPLNVQFLNKIDTAIVIGDDFLKSEESEPFDVIIANPPFSKNQDIDHVMKMWEMVGNGGRIVSVMSKHWQQSSNKKEKQFRDFLEENKAEVIEIDAGEFKESGTSIATCIVVINKPRF